MREKRVGVCFGIALMFFTSICFADSSAPICGPDRSEVAVIGGGGAGVTTAWLLDDQYKVTLFENTNRLGGHAHTIPVEMNGKSYPIDAGFEFIAKPEFPYFFSLLKTLDVPLSPFQLTVSFFDHEDRYNFVVTPISKDRWALGSLLKPYNLITILRLKYVFEKAKKYVGSTNAKDEVEISRTLESFTDTLSLSRKYKNQFLYPFLASGWGVSREEIKKFSAYYLFATLLTASNGYTAPEWIEIVGGTSTYIRAAESQLQCSSVKLNSNISRISKSDDQFVVTTDDGTDYRFKHLVLAVPLHQVRDLLKELPEFAELSSVVDKVKYYQSTLVLHGDERFMPKDHSHWSVVNMRSANQGSQSSFTVYKPWLSPTPIFKSWILPGDPEPLPLYAKAQYHHPLLDQAYINSQKTIAEYQGRSGIWFAGVHTQGTNRHESAVLSAIQVAERIAPSSARLMKVLSLVGETKKRYNLR